MYLGVDVQQSLGLTAVATSGFSVVKAMVQTKRLTAISMTSGNTAPLQKNGHGWTGPTRERSKAHQECTARLASLRQPMFRGGAIRQLVGPIVARSEER